MTLYEIFITNHSGFPFYRWENPNKPRSVINTVKFTRFPPYSEVEGESGFELKSGYLAAMSLVSFRNAREVTNIKEIPLSKDRIRGGTSEKDIIFDLAVDVYMNELNLYQRIRRAVDTLIFNDQRPFLEDKPLAKEEQTTLRNIFNDKESRSLINKNAPKIGRAIKESLEEVKGEEKKLYEYGILGVGLLSSSYNILFYTSLKTYLGLTEEEIDFPGQIPEGEGDLGEILSLTQMPVGIEGGESKFAYPFGLNIIFLIHNFDIGPEVLGAREPFHLIVGVRPGFPSKVTIDGLIQAITPYLTD